MKPNILKISLLVVFVLTTSISYASITPFLSQRKTIDLQEWSFVKGDRYRAQYHDASINWEQVTVPHTYSMDAITDVGYYQGVTWYSTTIAGKSFTQDERVFIRFEGVGQDAVLYLNGKKCGGHSGSYSAFVFELSEHWLYDEENVLCVKVDNSPHWKTIPVSNFLFNIYGGIYRSVALFSTPKTCISPLHYASSGIFVDTRIVNDDTAQLKVKVHVSSLEDGSEASLHLEVKNEQGVVFSTVDTSFFTKMGSSVEELQLELNDFTLWNGVKNPYLYRLEVSLKQENKTDKVQTSFGVRSFEVSPDKGFILNKASYKVNGVCRHQEWEQYANALDNAQHETDMELMLEMGVTGVRLAHYQQAEYMYQLADEKGLIVWAEIPRVHTWTGGEHANSKQQLSELILQNYNHPSICFWGLFNEVRGFNKTNAPCVKLTYELNRLAHQLDSSRLTTSATDRNMGDAMNAISDTQGWNKYFGWYGNDAYSAIGPFFDEIHEKYPHLMIAVSEYGAGANIQHQDVNMSQKPMGNYFPEQDQSICHEESWQALKNRDYLWGTFVWNMFDFGVNQWFRGGVDHMNHKGLITFDRKIMKDAFYFYKANWNDEPMLHLTEKRNKERYTAKVTIKAYSNLGSKVTLFINGKKYSSAKANDIHIVRWNDVLLDQGKNTIRISAKNNTINYSDTTEWVSHFNAIDND